MPEQPSNKISDLLQAEPFTPEPVRAALERMGFGDKPATQALPLKSLTSRRRASKSTPSKSTASWIKHNAAPTHPAARAEKLIDGLATTLDERTALFAILNDLLDDLSEAADPLRALLNFSRLSDVVGDRAFFFHHLQARPSVRLRLCELLGFSQALADTLIRQPELLDLIRLPQGAMARAVLRSTAHTAIQTAHSHRAKLDALRRFRRAQTLRIGLMDMERQTWRDVDDFHRVVRQISDLAQVCVEQMLALVTEELGIENHGFTVIAMGKLGARELNYSSDIDLLFIHDREPEVMQKLGQALLRELADASPEGTLYRVDMRLRPDGQSGTLVTPIGYALSYYESYAAAWEWQALIKSRAIAGDAHLARRFRKFTRGVTWARRADDTHLREILEMKRRSEATPDGSDAGNVKQGPGAIRDAEWIVQQLQMMVGPQHPRARAADTLRALEVLLDLQAMTPDEARTLRAGYLFLRAVEHRLQLLEERAVRTLPAEEGERAALARRMGYSGRGAVAARWLDEEHERYRSEVRALAERMFWGWREPVKLVGAGTGDDYFPASSYLLHPSEDAQRRLQRIAGGTSTQPLPAPLARQIVASLPDALRHIDHAANPERAVANLELLCDASGNRLSLLRSLSASPALARAVFAILGGSQSLTDTILRFPELLDLAARRDVLKTAKSWEQARADCRSYCLTFRDHHAALRRWKRREMLRIGLRDLVLDASPHDITAEIAGLARACLMLACDDVGQALQPHSGNIGFAVIGMGKLGGGEMHYQSDADVIFVYQPYGATATFESAAAIAKQWAEELMRAMGEPTEDGTCFQLDPRLRPEGRSGTLAPSVAACIDYFERPISGIAVWERQALTRAQFVAGDAETAAEFIAASRHVAFPGQWQPEWGEQLRHIKARVENERAAKGPSAKGSSARGVLYDVKLGPGTLSDIEFCAQWLALKHGTRLPELQTSNTRRQIAAARETGVLPAHKADALSEAYTFLRRAELRLQITAEHAIHAVKRDSKEFTSWARAVFPDEPDAVATMHFEEEWQRLTQPARDVMERVRDEL